MPDPDIPKDKTPPALKEGGVKTGREGEKKSFTDSAREPTEPAPEGGMTDEGQKPERPKEGGMLSEG